MKKTKKKIEDFLFDDSEITYIEKALYALTDKLKAERLDKKFNVKEENYMSKVLESCSSKLKLHKNFLIRKDLYIIQGIKEEEVTSAK